MAPTTNKRVLFIDVPTETPVPGKHTKLVEEPFDPDTVPLNGGVLVKNHVISLDPYMRSRMRHPDTPGYTPAYKINQPLYNFGVMTILRSEHSRAPFNTPGTLLYGGTGIETYSILPKEVVDAATDDVRHLQTTGQLAPLKDTLGLPLSFWVGAGGMPGQTAAMGLWHIIGDLEPGRKIFVTAAAGPVGQMVISLCKRAGMQVIATAGSDEKLKYVKEKLHADRVFNYKTADMWKELEEFGGKEGIDYYWDNVAGDPLEAYLDNAKKFGVIVACGSISNYNLPREKQKGPRNIAWIWGKDLRMQGFLVGSIIAKYASRFYDEIPPALARGELPYLEDVTRGIEGTEDAFVRLQTGKNNGKTVVVIDLECQ